MAWVILTDMFRGTPSKPCQISVMRQPTYGRVLAGINLPMLSKPGGRSVNRCPLQRRSRGTRVRVAIHHHRGAGWLAAKDGQAAAGETALRRPHKGFPPRGCALGAENRQSEGFARSGRR